VALCIVDAFYHTPDVLFVFDGNAAPPRAMMAVPYERAHMFWTVLYKFLREVNEKNFWYECLI
jgi:hypothetical protein